MNNKKTLIAAFTAAICLASSTSFAAAVTKAANEAIKSKIDQSYSVLNQNSAQTQNKFGLNWKDRIFIGGLANFEASFSNTRPIGGFIKDENSSDINVNNANLFIDAKVNPWINAHLNLAYLRDQLKGWEVDKTDTLSGSWLGVDEAYVDFGNFVRTPFAVRAGKQYVAFGSYDRYPIIMPLTQILSQTRATAITGSVVTETGFYAHAFAFSGPTDKNRDYPAEDISNVGGKVGYYGGLHYASLPNVHYNVNLSLIYNMYDVSSIANFYLASIHAGGYNNKVGGIAFHGDLAYQRFSLALNYVSALDDLKLTDDFDNPIKEGRLWALDVTGGFKFKTGPYDSEAGLSYQQSGNGDKIDPTVSNGRLLMVQAGLPHYRLMAQYTINVLSNTYLSAAYAYNRAYKDIYHADYSNELIARLSVRF